ncbi:MAG: GYF domain-containing protein [Prevotella sp.]
MNYFIIENGLQVGPFSAEILVKNKNITAETLVWADGFADWTPAWQVEELRIMLQANTQVQQTPPPVPPYLNNANNQETEPKKEEKKEKKPRWKGIAIVAVAIMIILAIANPSKDSHKDAIKKELTEAMDKINERENGGDDLLSMGLHVITKMLSDDTVDSTLDDMLNYHNYIIYSISDVKFDGREHNVSYGFLGHVYTVNADDIVKCYESKMNSSSNEEISNDTDSKSDAVEDNSKDKKDKSDDALDKAADKIVDKVSKKVQDKVDEKLSEKLNEAADSTDGIIDKICKILGL